MDDSRDQQRAERLLVGWLPVALMPVEQRPVWRKGISVSSAVQVRRLQDVRSRPGPQPTLVSLPVSFVGKIWVGRSAPSRPTDRGSDRDHQTPYLEKTPYNPYLPTIGGACQHRDNPYLPTYLPLPP